MPKSVKTKPTKPSPPTKQQTSIHEGGGILFSKTGRELEVPSHPCTQAQGGTFLSCLKAARAPSPTEMSQAQFYGLLKMGNCQLLTLTLHHMKPHGTARIEYFI